MTQLRNTMAATNYRPLPVTAFVDWNSQIYNAGAIHQEPNTRAKITLKKTTRAISKILTLEDQNCVYHVALRLYHGWHKGWERTENLLAIMQAVADVSFSRDYSTRNVLFRQYVEYGHTLLSALPSRQHRGPQFHLANTLRRRNNTLPPEEKLVDTALAADLLHWARESPTDWALILAEDDDIVPPIFTAEAWIQRFGGKMLLVRKRSSTPYVKTDGLLRRIV